MITVERFLGLNTKELVQHFKDLGYTQLSQIFNHKDFAGNYDLKTGHTDYPLDKVLPVLGIDDSNNAIVSIYPSYWGTRVDGGRLYIEIDPSKLTTSNNPKTPKLPNLRLEYHLFDNASKLTKAHISSNHGTAGVYDQSAYWIAKDEIFDKRPEYTKFGMGLAYDCNIETVAKHIEKLYEAAETLGVKAQEFCDRAFKGELKKEVEDITGETIKFAQNGMHHMTFTYYLTACVEDGMDFSDLAVLCAGSGMGVCSNTELQTQKIMRSCGDVDIKEFVKKFREYFDKRPKKSKDDKIAEAYADFAKRIKGMRPLLAAEYGLKSSDLPDIVINGTKL